MPTWPEIELEARRLVDGARDRGAVLRVVGSTGIRLRCERAATLMDRAQRRPKDIDVVCRKRDRGAVRELFESHGYDCDRDMLVSMEGTRYAYRHPGSEMELDVFVDELRFCHTLDLRERLDGESPAVPAEDLLLQKLQIIEPTAGDMVDVTALLAHSEVGAGDGPCRLDAGYVAGVLARDWGFHHTVVRNLRRVVEAGGDPAFADARERAAAAATALLDALEAEPKSLAWRARARIGERKQWWQDVQDDRVAY